MQMQRILLVTGFIFCVLFTTAQPFNAIVSADGSDDYTTVQEAINAMPSNSASRSLIFIKNGTYNEKIEVAADKINISLIGENVDGVTIEYNDYAGKDGMSSAESYTLLVGGADFYMENITVKNTAGNVGQALAINTEGDRGIYKNCKFYGFQDTYYAHKKRQYNYKCYVEGGTDFIYGDATAVFDYCQINCVSGGQYITAPADTKFITQFTTRKFLHGLLFRMCDITADDGVPAESYYLGRPWQPYASSVYVECTLGNHIKPIGWSTWSDDTHLTSYFAEYQSVDTNGNLVDVSNRADWSYQLEVFNYQYELEFFLNGINSEKWNPVLMTRNLLQPENVSINGDVISWNKVDQAIGYIIYNEGAFYASSTDTFFVANGLSIENVEVKSVYKTGALSSVENNDLVAVNHYSIGNKEIKFSISGNTLKTTELVKLTVYNMNGKKVLQNGYALTHALTELEHGVLLLQLEDVKGNKRIQKIIR